MSALAALPMYDLEELRAATDAWWAGLARALRREGVAAVPRRLERRMAAAALWRHPRLLLAQSCGLPLLLTHAATLRLVATPCFAAPGCDGSSYRSAIVVRAGDRLAGLAQARGRRVAINARDSHSGCNVLRAMVAPLAAGGRFFGKVVVTGAHPPSLEAVDRGLADIAAIDAVTLALLARHRPRALAGLRVLAWSPPAPGLPYVTAAWRGRPELARLRAGLRAALALPALADVRAALLLDGAELLPLAAYAPIRAMRDAARAAGYRELDEEEGGLDVAS